MPAFSQLFEDPMAAIGYGLLTSGQNPVGAAMGVMQQAEQNKQARDQAEFQKLMMQYKMQQAQNPKPKLVPNSATGGADQYQYDPASGSYYPMPMGQGPGIQMRDIPPPSQYDTELGAPPSAPAGNIDDLVRQQLSTGGFAPRGGFNRSGSPNMAMPPQLPAQIPDTAMPQMTPIPKPTVNNPKDARKLKDAEIDLWRQSNEPLSPADAIKLQDKKKKYENSLLSALTEMADTSTVLNESLPMISGYSAGTPYSQYMKESPILGAGSDAINLEEKLKPVLAREGFGNLQEMRNNSPTGGALGSIAVKELEMLQAKKRSLNTAQKGEQLTKNIIEYNNLLRDTAVRLSDAYEKDFGRPLPDEIKKKIDAMKISESAGGGSIDPRIAKAKAAGYTDEEIQQYLRGKQ